MADESKQEMYALIATPILRQYRRVQQTLACLQSQASPHAIISPGSVQPRTACILLPGSFNPPTLAHLAMLRQAQAWARHRQSGHWQVYAALSLQIVEKEQVQRMTTLDRVILLEHLLHGWAGVLLLNCGLYVEQAQGIRAAFPHLQHLYFLLGFDKIVQILDARYYADRDAALHSLFALAQLLVAPRGAEGEEHLRALCARPENRPFARSIHPLPLDVRYREISSTSARQGRQLDDLPEEVADFIRRTRPYQTYPTPADDLYTQRIQALEAQLTGSGGERSGGWSRSGRYRPR